MTIANQPSTLVSCPTPRKFKLQPNAPRLQSHRVQPAGNQSVGPTRYQGMVHWTSHGPLPMLSNGRPSHKERTHRRNRGVPYNFEMPPTSSADLAIQAAQELTAALRKPQPAAPFLEPLHRHNKAKIFQAAATPPPAPRVPTIFGDRF